jgi:hypothetical protein
MDSDEITFIRRVVENQTGQECGFSATFAMLKGLLATMDMLQQLLLDRTAAPQVTPAAPAAPPDLVGHLRLILEIMGGDSGYAGLDIAEREARKALAAYDLAEVWAERPPAAPPPHEVVEALRGLLDILNIHGASDGSDYWSAVINRREIARQALTRLDAGETPAPDPKTMTAADAARMVDAAWRWMCGDQEVGDEQHFRAMRGLLYEVSEYLDELADREVAK